MEFSLFVILTATGEELPVQIVPAQEGDLQVTRGTPAWQTDWTSEFLAAPMVDKYAVKAADGELIALGAYQIRGHSAYVYIIYAESAPPSNPTIKTKESRKYYGIGELLIAYGIKYYSATAKERFFVEKVARVTYERERAQKQGLPLSDVRPAFAS